MSAYDPLRLVNLAAMSLVRDEALAICSLEYLPMELYPPLFMATFSGRHSETLKAMVQAWPFARLPLGGLMQKPHQGTIQAVLHGLDVLFAQKVHPRRCKLRVLDLRNTGQDFWNIWSGDMDHVPSSSMMAPIAEDMSRTKHPLTPLMIHGSVTEEQDHQALLQFTSQILRLQYLRDLRMEGPSFLEGRLNQMLRCLKTSLYDISITNCLLTESDLTHLSQCWNICQLKGLNLNGVTLTNFRAKLLQVLLEKVAGTLEELDLNLCGIMDSHLMAILPVLSSCSQLRVLSLCGNLISMTVLESLLCHTDGLSALSLEFYPAPRESYSSLSILHQERLAQLKAELWEILTDLGRPRKIWISPSPCPHCSEDMCYHLSPNA
ncbi:PRAME family member 12-like [Oryx dammah]|uniref:PRAME family member 12-like n=1 Tax=Oryx dammah TaxID=59534 RepID=UPI001A9A80A8|nr:PRAME family member 12-like [Oryx dammah]